MSKPILWDEIAILHKFSKET